jgi:hypothetical protein
MAALIDSIVEDSALECSAELGFAVEQEPHLTTSEPAATRDSLGEVPLRKRSRYAIRRLNSGAREVTR